MKVLIIGASGEIGKAIARQFVNHEVIAPTREEMNLLDEKAIAQYMENISEIDILIYAAGINIPRKFKEITDTDLDTTFRVNVAGFLQVAEAVLPHCQRIVAISSLYGHMSREDRLAYCMSKHALNGAVRTLSMEYARNGLLANTISPGFINTEMTRRNNDPAVLERIRHRIPVGKLGQPDAVAKTAYFLCVDNAYITGQDIIVDGGFSINGGI